MCFWTNPGPESNLDDFDWIRQFSYGNFGPKRDHSKKNELGYFMSLTGDQLEPKRGGTYAWLISGEFAGSSSSSPKKCMSFYYYMYQRVIDPSGPSLGGLRVYIRTTDSSSASNVILLPVWRLNNHQSMKWRRASVPLVVAPAAAGGAGDGSGAGGGGGSGEASGRRPPANPFQVVIEGVWGDARVGSIALDDISFVDGDCSSESVSTFLRRLVIPPLPVDTHSLVSRARLSLFPADAAGPTHGTALHCTAQSCTLQSLADCLAGAQPEDCVQDRV